MYFKIWYGKDTARCIIIHTVSAPLCSCFASQWVLSLLIFFFFFLNPGKFNKTVTVFYEWNNIKFIKHSHNGIFLLLSSFIQTSKLSSSWIRRYLPRFMFLTGMIHTDMFRPDIGLKHAMFYDILTIICYWFSKIIIHLLGKIHYLRVCVHRYLYLPL